MNTNNTFYFLRHGETIKDPSKPAIIWDITAETGAALSKLANQPEFKGITAVYSSTEVKARRSAQYFSDSLTITTHEVEGLEEVHRGTAFLSDEEFNRVKREKLEQRDSTGDGGESSNMALERFQNALRTIDSAHNNEHILIASHGTILALYFSHLKNDFSHIFDYWKNMEFCAVGIVREQQILKDIST